MGSLFFTFYLIYYTLLLFIFRVTLLNTHFTFIFNTFKLKTKVKVFPFTFNTLNMKTTIKAFTFAFNTFKLKTKVNTPAHLPLFLVRENFPLLRMLRLCSSRHIPRWLAIMSRNLTSGKKTKTPADEVWVPGPWTDCRGLRADWGK